MYPDPPAAAAARARHRLLILLVGLAAFAAVLTLALVGLASDRRTPPSPPNRVPVMRLDHAAVEEQIEGWGYTGVACDHGVNPPIIVHSQFSCTAAGGQLIVVTITTTSGNYVWGLTG